MYSDKTENKGRRLLWPLLTVLVLAFCEYLPKAWFQAAPSSRVLPFAGLLKALAIVLWPLTAPLNAVMRRLSRQKRGDPDAHRLLVSREELLLLASEGVQSGVLTPQETEMIHGVFALPHKTCGSLMVPREKMVVVDRSMTVPDFLASFETDEKTEIVDLTDELRQSIILALPTYPVCRADCRGVCPTCGKNLNEGPCACVHEERDGRWGALDVLLPGTET